MKSRDALFARRIDADAIAARLRNLDARAPFELPRDEIPRDFAESSVLIAFWREEKDLRVLLTERAASLRGHPGQMSFPGGRLESGEDFQTAALRETHEEVGIAPAEVQVLGRLDDAWSGSRHRLVPVVGWLSRPPRWVPNPDEVARVHTPTIGSLLRLDRYRVEPVQLGGEHFRNEALAWEDGEIFGLSADLLLEALAWGLGEEGGYGVERLRSLRAYLREKRDASSSPSEPSPPAPPDETRTT